MVKRGMSFISSRSVSMSKREDKHALYPYKSSKWFQSPMVYIKCMLGYVTGG